MQIFTICKLPPYQQRWLRKLLITMKLTTFLMIMGCVQLHAAVYSQTVNLSERNVSLETVISKIEKQTGYTFFSRLEVIRAMPRVNVTFKNVSITEALDQLLQKFPLSYSIVDKTVVINLVPQTAIALKAQPRIYVGKVLDEKDQPFPGVIIKFKGAKNSSVTDQNGQFTSPLSTDPKDIMMISYLGYMTQEIPVSQLKNPIVIKMKPASSDLDQVQITAYGTTTKRESTGNITTLTAADIAKNPARNVLEIIQGQVPGLFIQQLSGLPGSPFDVKIRGQQTIAGGFKNSQPLIIVDGIALPSGALPLYQTGATGENLSNELKGGNPLDYIDPSTIESLSVLKDADATSIYGSRGAYGVILITTKKGREGTPRLSLNSSMGLTVRGTAPELLNTEQYIMLRKEALKNDGTAITNTAAFSDVNGIWPADRYTDWQKEFAGNKAMVRKVNANYSGGASGIAFLIGGNYRQQNSIQIGKGSVKDGGINFNINNSIKNNKFSINLSGSFLSTVDDAVPYDFSQSASVTAAPNAPPLFLPDGSLNWETNSNPAAAMNIIYKNTTNNLRSNLGLRYAPVKGLTMNADIGYNYMNSKSLRAQPSTYYQPGTAYRTTSTLNLYSVSNLTIEPNITYETRLGKKGTFMAKTGGTLQNQLNYVTYTTGNDFISDALLYNPSFADPLTTGPNPQANITSYYNQNPNKYIGFFGIIKYDWDKKYFLSLNGRRDGSTKFGADHQFGNFGSAAASWVISNEEWFKSILPIVSFAKLRGSIGTSGGDGIDNYGYLTTYSKNVAYQGSLSLKADNLSNKDLHWEKNRKTEGGLTFELFNGRIYVDASYYNSVTTDQLVSQLLPSTTGFTARTINSPAVIRNWGYEFELTSKNISSRGFTWNTRFNISLPKNKLVAYPDIEKTQTNLNLVVGQPVQGIRVYNYAGVDPQTGLFNFINRFGVQGTFRQILDPVSLDVNLDKTQFIDLTPKFYGGISNTFNYKGISLDVLFTFTSRMAKSFLGYQIYPVGFQGQNLSTSALDRWQKPGDITDVQKAGSGLSTFFSQGNFTTSSGAYEKATYARLSSLNISYALPSKLIKSLHIGGLSIFAQGSNLLTISKYGDLDPENLGAGMAPLRFFTGGLNITL